MHFVRINPYKNGEVMSVCVGRYVDGDYKVTDPYMNSKPYEMLVVIGTQSNKTSHILNMTGDIVPNALRVSNLDPSRGYTFRFGCTDEIISARRAIIECGSKVITPADTALKADNAKAILNHIIMQPIRQHFAQQENEGQTARRASCLRSQ